MPIANKRQAMGAISSRCLKYQFSISLGFLIASKFLFTDQKTFYSTELIERWKTTAIERINSFEGFDAAGFFTLGRPNLTSIVANFITFIIMLIQFYQSEPK